VYRIHRQGLLPAIHNPRIPFILAFGAALLSRLVLVVPLAVAIVYAIAWWKIKQGKPAARRWAIAASLVTLLQSLLFTFVVYIERSRLMHSRPADLAIICGLMVLVGVAGLFAFAPRNALADTPINAAKPPRIAGDGTNRLFDTIAWLFGTAGYLGGMFLWRRWGYSAHLPTHFGSIFWLWLALALLLSITLHESGHALVGISLGMKLRMFMVGPFRWSLPLGKWKFQFLPKSILGQGGAAALVPTDPNQPSWREILMIAAGPLANLFTGLIAVGLGLASKHSPYEGAWYFLALFSTLSLVLFAANLVPVRPEAAYSDGARIYQILRGGPLADLHRCFAIAGAIMVTPLRPRNYDIEALQRAADAFTKGQQAMLLRLLAYNYFHDCGQITEACHALDQAEAIYHQSASEIPAQWHTVFVFGNAFLKRDSAAARAWWERMQAKNPTDTDEVYWLCDSALLWSENSREQANEAWNKGHALAAQRPHAGAYDFNRDCFSQLREALDASASAG
jgi:Zn-dependent protease